MEEYRIDIKVRNNIILKKLEESGYKTIGEFCRINNCTHMISRIHNIVNMKISPLNKDGSFNNAITKVSEIIGCSPEDLFTDTQLHTELKTNKRSLKVNEAEMRFMLENIENSHQLLEDHYHEDQKQLAIQESLSSLNSRQKLVIEMRMGLGDDGEVYTLEEVGDKLGISRARVRQIESKAIRILRHPDRADKLREYIQ